MKLLNIKLKKEITKANKQDGFVALYSVLVSSMLLIMALSISGVAYKEQLFSINAKASQYSFMAADTGMECALLADVKLNNYVSVPGGPSIITDFKCAGNSLSPIQTITATNTYYAYKLPVTATANGINIQSCAVFSINKAYDSDSDGNPDSTKIDSRGYNVDCNNIDYGVGGIGDIQFINGAGQRAVERYLGAIYSNT